MSLAICSQCGKMMSNHEFNFHSCVTAALNDPREVLLKRLLESGGCTQEYYNQQMGIQS